MPPKKKHTFRHNSRLNPRPVQQNPQGGKASCLSLCQCREIPVELLQLLLGIFNDALSPHAEQYHSSLIQEVKRYLYHRDFNKAFGRAELLEAYAGRWSPSRALAYINILCSLPVLADCLSSLPCGDVDFMSATGDASHSSQDLAGQREEFSRIVCIGAGGGAEIVAVAGFLNHFKYIPTGNGQGLNERSAPVRLQITAIDIANWETIVSRLHSSITTAPSLSQYASAGKKVANRPLIDASDYKVRFLQEDILSMERADLAATFTNVPLVTLMFTLNELYNTSINATTNLLLSLSMILSPGALLLVVDSPGSYSTVEIGTSADSQEDGATKKYPMQWLLDHTLLESAAVGSSRSGSAGGKQWEKLESRESEWFRLPKGLVYSVALEDMRCQVHLYRRI